MKIKFKFLTLILTVLMLLPLIISCKGNDDGEDTGVLPGDDDFTGSIAGDGVEGGDDGNEEEPLPIAPGDENAVYEISSYEDFKNKIAQNGTFILQNDIVITDDEFKPIGTYVYPFMGKFDGGGHTITYKATGSDEGMGFSMTFKFIYSGLFAVTKDAEIKNLTVNVDVSASSDKERTFVLSGGIAGYMINTTVTGCAVNGAISSNSSFFNAYSGGICGVMEGGKVDNCSVNATIKAIDSENRAVSGGLIGYAIQSPAISHSGALGSVTAVSTKGIAYAGGLVGNATKASFTACKADCDVSATVSQYVATDKNHGVALAGGLCAGASGLDNKNKVTFTRCYALNSEVTAIGNNCTAFAGGIAALVSYADFKHCYTLTDVKLETGINIGYAGAAFGSITTTEPATSTSAADFTVDGCFAFGGVSTTHSKPEVMFIGTFYGYLANEKAKPNLKNVIYNSEAAFTLNGKTTVLLRNSGTPKDSSFFTLDNCITELGWSDTEWQELDGIIVSK